MILSASPVEKQAQHLLGIFVFWRQHTPHLHILLHFTYAVDCTLAHLKWGPFQQMTPESVQVGIAVQQAAPLVL